MYFKNAEIADFGNNSGSQTKGHHFHIQRSLLVFKDH